MAKMRFVKSKSITKKKPIYRIVKRLLLVSVVINIVLLGLLAYVY